MVNLATPDEAFWPPISAISDLTLKFQESILNILPSSIFITVSLFTVYHHVKKPAQFLPGYILWTKLATASALIVATISIFILRAIHTEFRTVTTIPANALDLLAVLTIAAVLFVEYRHAFRGSAFLSLYLLLGVCTDVIKCRSFFKRPGLEAAGALVATSLALRLLLVMLEEIPKTNRLVDVKQREAVGTEATSGYLTRTFFVFLNPLFLKGYRSALSAQDLSRLGPDFSSNSVHRQLETFWKRARGASKNGLAMVCFNAWRTLWLVILIPRLFLAGISFSQPLLLYRLIQVVGDPAASQLERGLLLAATGVSFIGSSVSRMATAHLTYRQATRMRSGLITQIFDKNLHLHRSEAKKSAAITLISNDVDGITRGLLELYEVIVTPLELCLGTYLLSRFVGRSCVTVIAPLILSAIATYFFGKYMAIRFNAWNASIQDRVAKTSKVLGQLKAIKMFGLGPTIGICLQQLRVVELLVSKTYRGLEAASALPVVCAELVTPVVVIAAALFLKHFDGGLSAVTVFPSLSLVVLIKQPLAVLLYSYPTFTAMMGCFQRVEAFLLQEERKDPRTKTEKQQPSLGGVASEQPPELPAIEFKGAQIAPVGSQVAILQDVDFKLQPGTVTGVVGENGSGKSLLLQSILGETELLAGAIMLPELLVAFCDQEVWLRNVSVKDNIIGSLPYDETLFRKILRCCLLDEDLAALPGGADYVVGTGGCKLSGGQRQRIELARTLFARMSILVLDDIFSALDRRTALSILWHLFGDDGLLKELNCTVVMTSYLPECIDLAAQLLVLDGNGHVSLQSNTKKEATLSSILSYLKVPSTLPTDKEKVEDYLPSGTGQPSSVPDNTLPSFDATTDWSLYPLFFRPIGRVKLSLWLLLLLVTMLGESMTDVYMRLWIDLHPEQNLYFIGYAGIAVTTCFLFALCSAILFTHFVPKSGNHLHQQIVNTVMHATLEYLGSTDAGVILNRFSQDMSLIVQQLPMLFVRTISVFYGTVIQSGIIASGASYMAVTLPLVALVVFGIQRFYLRTSRQIRAMDLEAKSPLYSLFEEAGSGILHIRAFGLQHPNLEQVFKRMDTSSQAFYYQCCVQLWLKMVLGLLVAAVATILTAFAMFLSHTTSQSAIGLSFLNLIMFAETLESLVVAWTGMETSITALQRIRDFSKNTPQERGGGDIEVPAHWPSLGNIQLIDVSARYSSNHGHGLVLNNMSLSIDAGQRVSIVGRTGSGKSSIILAILGFIPYEGCIKIDGIDLSAVPLDTLRSRIVTISQDQIAFDASVRTNLLPFTLPAADESRTRDGELQELLSRLDIWSHVEEHGGLGANIEDVGYSKGEMQLFCIARAALRCQDTGSKVVLMDEATSSVETGREKATQEIMKQYFKDCTLFVIGHRESSLRGVDVAVEVSHGQVVQIQSRQNTEDS